MTIVIFAARFTQWSPGCLKFLSVKFLLHASYSWNPGADAQTCTQTPFPKFVGGSSGESWFNSIDYHSATSQLVVGGTTYDSGITNN